MIIELVVENAESYNCMGVLTTSKKMNGQENVKIEIRV